MGSAVADIVSQNDLKRLFSPSNSHLNDKVVLIHHIFRIGAKMTCIIGLAENNKGYIGGDSASAASNSWTVRATIIEKVFRWPPFIFGCSTSFRMIQLLHYGLKDLPEQDYSNNMAYMVNVFVGHIRRLFKEEGFSKIDDNEETGGEFLVGYRNKLYLIGPDFQVNGNQDGLDAIGCGARFALGAMRALSHLLPKERILKSLEIAAYFSGGVLPPFVIEEGI